MSMLLHVCVGAARPLRVGTRTVLTGFRKAAVHGAVEAGPLGLAGDEQVELSVHGGLHKAVYAYPSEHLGFWQAERRERGVSLFGDDEALPPGFVGENLSIAGVQEGEVWLGDTLHFAGSPCVLRVTAPREPCGKFNAVMGFAEAARVMVREGRCGFYLAVQTGGPLAARMPLTLRPGPRRVPLLAALGGRSRRAAG